MRHVKKAIGNTILGTLVKPAKAEGLIFMPDQVVQRNITVAVNTKGPHVSNDISLGSIVMVAGSTQTLIFRDKVGDEMVDSAEYLFKEEDIMMVKIGKMYRPYGKYVLVERVNEEQQVGGIIIPSAYQTTDQSLFGIVVLNGWQDGKEIDSNVQPGDIIHIQNWDMKIKEVEIGGKFHLLVPTGLIDYKTNKEGLTENYVNSCL